MLMLMNKKKFYLFIYWSRRGALASFASLCFLFFRRRDSEP